MTEIQNNPVCFFSFVRKILNIENLNFDIVSNFEFRASDFRFIRVRKL